MNRIKELRRLKNPVLTQQKLADLVGVARSTVAMWEAGKNEPDNDTLLKLAEIFGVSTDYVLGAVSDSDSSIDDKRPRMPIKNKLKNWKSNKAARLYMCIDTNLLDYIDTFAKEDGISLEDEVEQILYWEMERRIEEYMDKVEAIKAAGLPLEKFFPSRSAVSIDSSKLELHQSEQQKKPTPVTEDGLDEMFMRYVQELTPDQQLMILDQMQRMTGQQKEPSSVFAQQITGETTP